MRSRAWSRIALTIVCLFVARQLAAYPGGTPRIVTNAAPYCASCHSSIGKEQVRDMPPDAQAGMLPDGRHFGEITQGEENYAKLATGDREKLIAAIKEIDAHSSVSLALSSTRVRPQGALTARVTTHGGGGPVVGVMLLDTDVRFQSSPVQVQGFVITAAPKVTGPDGAAQTQFLDGRLASLSKNINYVNIGGVKSDPAAGTYPECSVEYALKAPATPGTYTVTAAFLYGTEKGTALGRVEGPGGRAMPVGGRDAHAGRIAFTKPVQVTVR